MSSAAISTISLNVLINLGEFTHAHCLPNSTILALQTNNSICFHCGVMQALYVHASGGCWSQHIAGFFSVIYQETNVLINISFIFLLVEVHHAWKCVCSIWQDQPIKNSPFIYFFLQAEKKCNLFSQSDAELSVRAQWLMLSHFSAASFTLHSENTTVMAHQGSAAVDEWLVHDF